MNTLLVPIDFSECSHKALHFAVDIARATKAKIILFHSFHVPIPPPDAVVDPIPLPVLMEENKKRLQKIADDELLKNNALGTIDIVCQVTIGFATEEIVEFAKKHKVKMIVMGTQGASGIKKFVFGSNTASVIGKSDCPVLVIPEKAKFSSFKRIAVAVDLHEVKNNKVFAPLVELATFFNSEVKLFSVKKDVKERLTIEESMEKLNLDKVLVKIPHTFHLAKDGDVVHAIDTFVKDSHADLLTTLPQKHTFMELMLNKSITRDLAFHVHVPLLCLPENN